MWRFLRRQLKTKTGKAGVAIVTGVIVNAVAGEQVAAVARPIVTGAVVDMANGVFSAPNLVVGLVGMYLRDSAAKAEHG